MEPPQLEIEIRHLNWVAHEDDPTDLCAHGSMYVRIGNRIIVDAGDGNGWTVSAAALNFMRTLDRDYNADDFAGQLIPCCGFFMIADEDGNHVTICGCSSGFDWSIRHEENTVRHIAATGEEAVIGKQDYRRMVLDVADKVKQFYKDSRPKILPEDEADRKGYEAFWREWIVLRGKWE